MVTFQRECNAFTYYFIAVPVHFIHLHLFYSSYKVGWQLTNRCMIKWSKKRKVSGNSEVKADEYYWLCVFMSHFIIISCNNWYIYNTLYILLELSSQFENGVVAPISREDDSEVKNTKTAWLQWYAIFYRLSVGSYCAYYSHFSEVGTNLRECTMPLTSQNPHPK